MLVSWVAWEAWLVFQAWAVWLVWPVPKTLWVVVLAWLVASWVLATSWVLEVVKDSVEAKAGEELLDQGTLLVLEWLNKTCFFSKCCNNKLPVEPLLFGNNTEV
jgi:hypothetical protein